MCNTLDLVRRANFVLLRYETEHVPCTGITAVTRQERRAFRGGLMIAPWHERLDDARNSTAQRKVVETEWSFSVSVAD